MRRYLTAVLLLGLAFAARSSDKSLAQSQTAACGAGRSEDSVGCVGSEVMFVPGAASTGRQIEKPTGALSPSKARYVPYERIMDGPDGEPCVSSGQRALRPGEDAGLAEAAGTSGRDTRNILANYAPCPRQPEAGGAAQISPAEYAARFWRDVPLPKPGPHIAPGRAITGKLAYLETRGELTHTYNQETPVGPLAITATGRYYVDWGDGTTTGPHDSEGGPWPNGRITHEYIDVGSYDVVVTERWTATWRLGPASGNLSELRTTGRIDDFPVEQIQAVRYR